MGLEISKRYSSHSFHLMSAKRYEDIGYHGAIQAITFLGNRPSFKMLWHFEILTWDSMGKPKMWNISKTANGRANRRKFGTLCTTVYICWVLLIPDSLSLVWGHSVHFAKFPILQFLKLCSSPNFRPIHPNFIQGIIIIQAVNFSPTIHWCQTKLYENILYRGKSKCLLGYSNEKLASST